MVRLLFSLALFALIPVVGIYTEANAGDVERAIREQTRIQRKALELEQAKFDYYQKQQRAMKTQNMQRRGGLQIDPARTVLDSWETEDTNERKGFQPTILY